MRFTPYSSSTPLSATKRAPPPDLLRRLEDGQHVAGQLARMLREPFAEGQHRRHVRVVSAGVHFSGVLQMQKGSPVRS